MEAKRIGSGWISGVLALTLGALGLGGVFCFLYPEILTTPEVRNAIPLPYLRALLHFVLVSAFVLSLTSMVLRRNKLLGGAGLALGGRTGRILAPKRSAWPGAALLHGAS